MKSGELGIKHWIEEDTMGVDEEDEKDEEGFFEDLPLKWLHPL